LDPTDELAYYGRGLTHGDQRHFGQAVSDFTKAVEQGMKNYDKTWDDVRKVQELGGAFDEEFLKELRRVSGRVQ
jgi:hypothetical protein